MPETSRYKGESKADFAKRMASFADRINSPQKYGRLAQGGIQEIREGFPNSGGQIADTWRGLRSGLQEVSEGFPNFNIVQRGLQGLQDTYGPENYMRNLASGDSYVTQKAAEGLKGIGGQIADTYGPRNFPRNLRSGLQEVSEGLPNLNISNLPLGESNLLEAMTGGLVGGRPKRKGKKGKRAARDKQINDTRIDQYRP